MSADRNKPVTHGEMRDMAQALADLGIDGDDSFGSRLSNAIEKIFGSNPHYQGERYEVCERCHQPHFQHLYLYYCPKESP